MHLKASRELGRLQARGQVGGAVVADDVVAAAADSSPTVMEGCATDSGATIVHGAGSVDSYSDSDEGEDLVQGMERLSLKSMQQQSDYAGVRDIDQCAIGHGSLARRPRAVKKHTSEKQP